MSRVRGAVTARIRLALAVVLSGVVAVLVPSLSATTMDAPSAMVLGVVAATLAAVLGRRRHGLVAIAGAPAPPPGAADEELPFRAGRATDPTHHPLRPRAPGLV